MNIAVKIGIAGVGLFSLAMGVMSLFVPTSVEGTLGVTASTSAGFNTIGADFGAFFLACAIGCAGALFAAKTEWLKLPILLYGLAFAGRLIGALLAGDFTGVAQPMTVEAIMVGLCLFGYKTLSVQD